MAPSLEIGVTLEKDYYFGMLISWHYMDTKKNSRAPLKDRYSLSHEFHIDYYLDVLAKPGYKMTPNFMIYGLIGPSIARWSHDTRQFLKNNQIDTLKINNRVEGWKH